MTLNKKYENSKTIATYCLGNFGGIEILDIIYGIDDYVISCYNFGTGRQKIRHNKINYTSSGRAYFWKGKTRYYLDQFMRAA